MACNTCNTGTHGTFTYVLVITIVIAASILVPTILKTSKPNIDNANLEMKPCGFFTNKRCSPIIRKCNKKFVMQRNWITENMNVKKSPVFEGHPFESLEKFCRNEEICIGFEYNEPVKRGHLIYDIQGVTTAMSRGNNNIFQLYLDENMMKIFNVEDKSNESISMCDPKIEKCGCGKNNLMERFLN